MNGVLDLLERRAKPGAILVLLVLVLVTALGLLRPEITEIREASGGVELLDTELGFSPGTAFTRVEEYGDRGRSLYIRLELTGDIVFPALYGLFLALLTLFLVGKLQLPTSGFRRLALLPLAAVFADVLENVAIVWLLAEAPDHRPGVAWLAAGANLLKWGLVSASALIILLVTAMAVLQRLLPRRA